MQMYEISAEEIAAFLLTERIRLPDFPCHWTYVKTSPVWGGSIR